MAAVLPCVRGLLRWHWPPSQCFFVSDHCMYIKISDYKFTLEDPNEASGFVDYHGEMEISYDGEMLGIDTWEAPVGTEITNSTPGQSVTLFGNGQANLLVGAILVLLEAHGQPCYFNDENIQIEYKQMVQKAKDSQLKETVTKLPE